MSCRQARRELLEHFALGEELGSRSGPHLAHLQFCADCRREVGLDRELVVNLRRALRERIQGSAPSAASWELVRRRTIDQPQSSWTAHLVQWGGMLSAAAAAGVMLFAVATAPQRTLFPGTESPFVASAERRAVPPVDESRDSSPAQLTTEVVPQTPPFPGWPAVKAQAQRPVVRHEGEPPIIRPHAVSTISAAN
jgi:anti-sigma factor RsiW